VGSSESQDFYATDDRLLHIGELPGGNEIKLSETVDFSNQAARSYIKFNGLTKWIKEIDLTGPHELMEFRSFLDDASPLQYADMNIVYGGAQFFAEEGNVTFFPAEHYPTVHDEILQLFTRTGYGYRDKEVAGRCPDILKLLDTEGGLALSGSSISFGLKINEDGVTGFEFCEIKLARQESFNHDGTIVHHPRESLLCVKIPAKEDGRVAGQGYLFRQGLEGHMWIMRELEEQQANTGVFSRHHYNNYRDLGVEGEDENATPRVSATPVKGSRIPRLRLSFKPFERGDDDEGTVMGTRSEDFKREESSASSVVEEVHPADALLNYLEEQKSFSNEAEYFTDVLESEDY
jgi:hypothetical protein